MKIYSEIITIETKNPIEIYDMTERINKVIKKSRIKNGQVLVFTKHTTTGILINENEKLLLEDIRNKFEEIAPTDEIYLHDNLHLRECPETERKNGHAHLKAVFLHSTATIPIIEEKLALGTWQALLFFDFDGGRKREVIIQVLGEEK